MEYICQSLEKVDSKLMHQAFLTAFSDYPVKMSLSFEAYEKMLRRRGAARQISIGAFNSDNQLIGLMVNGLREWQGKSTAYDLMTGVVPAFRGGGVTKKMFSEVLALLKKEHVEQYLLEVLQENHAAVKLYRKQGFEVTRDFSVFKLEKKRVIERQVDYSFDSVKKIDQLDWSRLSGFWTILPSWQNSVASILAVAEGLACVTVSHRNQVIGYGLIDKETGDIPQIAVHKQYRRRGIGSGIVAVLREHTEAQTLSVVNVEDSCQGMKSFLIDIGFEQTAKQYEMILPLT